MGKVIYPYEYKMKDSLGHNLRRLRKAKNMTLEQLAIELNKRYGTKINKGMISKWENGHPAELESIKALALYFDVSLNEILGFDMKQTRHKIPIYEKRYLNLILKHDRTDMIPQESLIGYSSIPEHIKIKDSDINRLFYIKIDNDFMDKEYPKGSLVLIREIQSANEGDDILLSVGNGEVAHFGRYKKVDNLIFLVPVSNNSDNTEIIINKDTTDVEVLGKAILCIASKV